MNKELSTDYQAIAKQFGIQLDDIYQFASVLFKALGQDPKTVLDDKLLAEKESEALKASVSTIMKQSSDTRLGIFSEHTFLKLLRTVNTLVKASKEEKQLNHVKLAYKIFCIVLKSSESNCFSEEYRKSIFEKIQVFLNDPVFLYELAHYFNEKNKIQKSLGILKLLSRKLDKNLQAIQEQIKIYKAIETRSTDLDFITQKLEQLVNVYQSVPVLEAKVWAKRLNNLNQQKEQDPQFYYELARYYYKKNSYQTAARLFLMAVSLNDQLWDTPNDNTFPLFFSLSTALIAEGHFTQAVDILKHVPKTSNFSTHAENLLGFGRGLELNDTQIDTNHQEFISTKDIRLFNLSFYRKAKDLGNKEAIIVVNQYESELNGKTWNPSFTKRLSDELKAKGELQDDTGCKNN